MLNNGSDSFYHNVLHIRGLSNDTKYKTINERMILKKRNIKTQNNQ